MGESESQAVKGLSRKQGGGQKTRARKLGKVESIEKVKIRKEIENG
jgi:hypothetical protein